MNSEQITVFLQEHWYIASVLIGAVILIGATRNWNWLCDPTGARDAHRHSRGYRRVVFFLLGVLLIVVSIYTANLSRCGHRLRWFWYQRCEMRVFTRSAILWSRGRRSRHGAPGLGNSHGGWRRDKIAFRGRLRRPPDTVRRPCPCAAKGSSPCRAACRASWSGRS